MNDRKHNKTATESAIRVKRSRKRRAAARENPQAFPEVSNRQLLRDLEDNTLDEEEHDE